MLGARCVGCCCVGSLGVGSILRGATGCYGGRTCAGNMARAGGGRLPGYGPTGRKLRCRWSSLLWRCLLSKIQKSIVRKSRMRSLIRRRSRCNPISRDLVRRIETSLQDFKYSIGLLALLHVPNSPWVLSPKMSSAEPLRASLVESLGAYLTGFTSVSSLSGEVPDVVVFSQLLSPGGIPDRAVSSESTIARESFIDSSARAS